MAKFNNKLFDGIFLKKKDNEISVDGSSSLQVRTQDRTGELPNINSFYKNHSSRSKKKSDSNYSPKNKLLKELQKIKDEKININTIEHTPVNRIEENRPVPWATLKLRRSDSRKNSKYELRGDEKFGYIPALNHKFLSKNFF